MQRIHTHKQVPRSTAGQCIRHQTPVQKNLFRVHVAEPVLAPDNALYSIVSLSPRLQSGCEATVKLNQGVSTRDAISNLNGNYTLLGFEELLPSMNEIFIETVTDSNEQR